VLPDLHQELSQRSDELVRLRFVMTERMLITARHRPVQSVDNNRRAIEAGKRFPSALSFLDAIIDEFADAIGQLADRLGDDLDLIEDRVLHEQPFDDRARLGRIRLQLVRIHRQLAQLKSIFNRLDSRLSAQSKQVGQAIRALAQKLDAIDHEIDSLNQRARLLLDEMAARMAETTNRQLFTLSVLTACLLPPTLVTGIFGMNTKDLPFQNTDGGTYWAMLLAAFAGACCFWALRRLRSF
jgi:zinc transporter